MPTSIDPIAQRPASKQAQLDALRNAKQEVITIPTSPAGTIILNRKQLAAYLGLCARSIQNLERRGVMPRIKLGKRTVYRLDSVLATLGKLEKSEVA